jgi:hypothetical protein
MELFESESSIFTSNDILITNKRLILDDDVYLVNAITSIKRSNVEKNVPVITIAIGVGVFFIGLFLYAMKDTSGSAVIGLSIIILIIALFVWLAQKKTYKLIIHFSSGETKSIEDRAKEVIDNISISINEAVTKTN